jgi:hypothetical protein
LDVHRKGAWSKLTVNPGPDERRLRTSATQVVVYREELLARLKCSTLLPLREEAGVTLSEHLVDIIVQQVRVLQ